MKFEIHFKVEGASLVAFNASTKAKIELAKVRSNFFKVYLPHYGSMFEAYSEDLIDFINQNSKLEGFKDIGRIIELAYQHKKSLNLGTAYEPND